MSEIVKRMVEDMNFYRVEEKPSIPRSAESRLLRLDIEFDLDDVDVDYPLANAIANKIKSQITEDVTDLLENGDKDSTDPLHKVLDGERKLGVKFSNLLISNALYETRFIPKKDAVEYTVYFLVEPIL